MALVLVWDTKIIVYNQYKCVKTSFKTADLKLIKYRVARNQTVAFILEMRLLLETILLALPISGGGDSGGVRY